MYYKMFIPSCFPSLANFFTSNLHISKIIDNFVILTPSRGIFWLLCAIFLSLRLTKKNVGHYAVLEMYYTMFVPFCFQVWPIYRLQIDIFDELLEIL